MTDWNKNPARPPIGDSKSLQMGFLATRVAKANGKWAVLLALYCALLLNSAIVSAQVNNNKDADGEASKKATVKTGAEKTAANERVEAAENKNKESAKNKNDNAKTKPSDQKAILIAIVVAVFLLLLVFLVTRLSKRSKMVGRSHHRSRSPPPRWSN